MADVSDLERVLRSATHYDTLGIAHYASEDVIRQAYKR